jgi:hypothetical protein
MTDQPIPQASQAPQTEPEHLDYQQSLARVAQPRPLTTIQPVRAFLANCLDAQLSTSGNRRRFQAVSQFTHVLTFTLDLTSTGSPLFNRHQPVLDKRGFQRWSPPTPEDQAEVAKRWNHLLHQLGSYRNPQTRQHWATRRIKRYLWGSRCCVETSSGSGRLHLHWLLCDERETGIYDTWRFDVLKRLAVQCLGTSPDHPLTRSSYHTGLCLTPQQGAPRFDRRGLSMLRRASRYLGTTVLQEPAATPEARARLIEPMLSGRVTAPTLRQALELGMAEQPAARITVYHDDDAGWVLDWSLASPGRPDPDVLACLLFELEHLAPYTCLTLDHPLLVYGFDPGAQIRRLWTEIGRSRLAFGYSDRNRILLTLFRYRHLGCLRRIRYQLESIDEHYFQGDLRLLQSHGLLAGSRVIGGKIHLYPGADPTPDVLASLYWRPVKADEEDL